jgi:hypothetical protein
MQPSNSLLCVLVVVVLLPWSVECDKSDAVLKIAGTGPWYEPCTDFLTLAKFVAYLVNHNDVNFTDVMPSILPDVTLVMYPHSQFTFNLFFTSFLFLYFFCSCFIDTIIVYDLLHVTGNDKLCPSARTRTFAPSSSFRLHLFVYFIYLLSSITSISSSLPILYYLCMFICLFFYYLSLFFHFLLNIIIIIVYFLCYFFHFFFIYIHARNTYNTGQTDPGTAEIEAVDAGQGGLLAYIGGERTTQQVEVVQVAHTLNIPYFGGIVSMYYYNMVLF